MDREQFSSYAKRRSILYDTRAGSFISPDPRAHILSALQRSAVDGVLPRVIFAGEEHTHPLHHAMQYELIKAVNEIDDQPLMIGLEMCWRQHQRALDAFVFGDGSFEMLAKRTAWKRTWGYDLNNYAKVLAYARKERIRVVGLNAPYQLVATVGQVGVHGLPRELAAFLPEMDLSNEAHYRRFAERLAELGGAAPGSSSSGSPEAIRGNQRQSAVLQCRRYPRVPPILAAAAAVAAARAIAACSSMGDLSHRSG